MLANKKNKELGLPNSLFFIINYSFFIINYFLLFHYINDSYNAVISSTLVSLGFPGLQASSYAD